MNDVETCNGSPTNIVDKAFAKGGEQFLVGDLILYLADMESKQLVWVRHLRKLS